MKKISIKAAAIAIALCATVVTGCNNKNNETKAPKGITMGDVTVVSKGSAYRIVTVNGYEDPTDYTKVTDHKDFLSGHTDNGIMLLDLNGNNFAVCDSFSVKHVYPVKSGDTVNLYIELILASGNHVARTYVQPHTCMSEISGVKEEIYPLSNGWLIFKMKGLYGFAKGDAEDPTLDAVCKEISVVSVKDKIYFLVKSSDYTGYVDIEGNGIKSLTPAAYKKAKNSGTKLWSEGAVSGLEKDKL